MLKQNPLFIIQYEYICDECWKKYEWKKKATKFVKAEQDDKYICEHCVKKHLEFWETCFYKWVLYHKSASSNIRMCDACNKYYYADEDTSQYYCNNCLSKSWEDITYCNHCWKVHKKEWWLCWWNLKNDLDKIYSYSNIRFTGHKEWKTREPKWSVTYRYAKEWWIEKLPFQEERWLVEWIKQDLNEFYSYWEYEDDEPAWNFWIDNYYFWQNTEITWEVTYKRYSWLRDFASSIKSLHNNRKKDIEKWLKQNKYRNHYFKDITEDWLILRDYVDMMWNIKEKKESINVYAKDMWLNIDNVMLSKKVYYRLSSNLSHKERAFWSNERFGSCQQDHNCKTYASWAYDAITNWCNCPILLFNKKEDMYKECCDDTADTRPIWRITSRIMYDKDWKMYILLDRLYQDWTLSSEVVKWNIYKWIIMDLKAKWYNVVVTNYSAHDESTLQYLKWLWVDNTDVVYNLSQPLRRLYNVNWEYWTCWYYSDWGIEVAWMRINWLERATDFLDKAYVM